MSGEQGQAPPPTAAEAIEQEIAQNQIQQAMRAVSPFAGLGLTAQDLAQQAAGSAGKGYEFSPAEIEVAIEKFENVLDKATATGDQLQRAIESVAPPAPDAPSGREANATRESLRSAQDHNTMLQRYATSFLRELRRARTRYQQTEDANAANARGLM